MTRSIALIRLWFGCFVIGVTWVWVATASHQSLAARPETGVRLERMRFDPRCDENASVRCRNKEVVWVRNDSVDTKNLRGWTIHDLGQDFVYSVRHRTRLKPGERLILYSGRGQDLIGASSNGSRRTTYYYHWDRRREVWENNRDRATLKRRDGSVADRCGYGRRAHRRKVC